MKTLAICAVLLAGPLALGAGPAPTRKPPPTIRHIAVEDGGRELEVKITATEPLTPVIQIVTDPDRLIVDFPDALPGPELGSLFFDGGALRAVRVGMRRSSS